MTLDLAGSGRTPRIAIMGEFSAGKSTLCNLLMRMRALPEKVTATQLAPVWMTRGPGQHMRVTTDGEETPVSLDALDAIPFDDTLYIRLCLEADILDHCDFIDFPGISDPNMDAEVWERVLTEADAVIWLTHATQAWRQSEAAVWAIVPEDVQARSVLLATRFDKLVSESDRARVMHRLNKEAGPYFDKVFPISLIHALQAEDDYDAWVNSGAAAMMDHLAQLIGTLSAQSASRPAPQPKDQTPQLSSEMTKTPEAAAPAAATSLERSPSNVTPIADRIIPRRVKPCGTASRRRPVALEA